MRIINEEQSADPGRPVKCFYQYLIILFNSDTV